MTSRLLLLSATLLGAAAAQSGSKSIVTNLANAETGGIDLLVRYPAGHVFAPHWHESNERIIVAEGTHVNAGGYAFLRAHEIQRLSCTSATRCTFYLSWDGNPKSHTVSQPRP